MSKRNRITDEKLCAQTRQKPCEACGKYGPNECHHIITRARLGPDLPYNLMSLCGPNGCHKYWHDKPHSEFFEKFPHIITNLVNRGFFWEPTFKKLIPDWTKVSLG